MSRISGKVKIGDHLIMGGGFPVVIQTMWKDRLYASDLEGKSGEALAARINRLQDMGCGLLRFAVPDTGAAELLGKLAAMVSMPLSADIHFDYKIALRCLDFPIAKIRINPGNIGSREKVRAVLEGAAQKNVPIRIGLNAGSLPSDLRTEVNSGRIDSAQALVTAAERELAIFYEFGFTNVVVSMKASGIADTIKANRLLANKTAAPLHIGVTEAGPLIPGVVRNTAALLALLNEGIGDTIRVSLSEDPEKEVIAGREILGAAAELAGKAGKESIKQPDGIRIVSCPRCGRSSFDSMGFAQAWQDRLYALKKKATVAIMGCAVNGPEEARHADLGITGTGDKVLIFRNGKLVRTINAAEADRVFEEELERL
ncbi:MAG: (E)-4-hydroxy-3-methylbut-2-enyl-diphosphate synthase [Treponema sp.]|nr:(E)-4-hydroxy-3-methylbut-2-enyl-diphosphate synthase [Treponema sp.]